MPPDGNGIALDQLEDGSALCGLLRRSCRSAIAIVYGPISANQRESQRNKDLEIGTKSSTETPSLTLADRPLCRSPCIWMDVFRRVRTRGQLSLGETPDLVGLNVVKWKGLRFASEHLQAIASRSHPSFRHFPCKGIDRGPPIDPASRAGHRHGTVGVRRHTNDKCSRAIVQGKL
jgi:hypothetical protein